MTLERVQRRVHSELQHTSDITKFVSVGSSEDGGTLELTSNDKNVIVTISSTYTYTIKLPPVGECVGEVIAIQAQDVGGGLTIASDDALGWSNVSLGSDNDYAVFYSNGYSWFTLVST